TTPAPIPVEQKIVEAAQSAMVASPATVGRGVLYALLILLTVTLAASILLIIHLLNWRYRVSDTQVSVVPNELLKLLEDQVGGFNQTASYIGEYRRLTIICPDLAQGVGIHHL
ncbi:MAG: hypothetical protein GY777_00185, partial [Candidatus Brocadiaceae bacterium]|nr:hypothetical protein [Candidatus Brocadiaceae bacterium]